MESSVSTYQPWLSSPTNQSRYGHGITSESPCVSSYPTVSHHSYIYRTSFSNRSLRTTKEELTLENTLESRITFLLVVQAREIQIRDQFCFSPHMIPISSNQLIFDLSYLQKGHLTPLSWLRSSTHAIWPEIVLSEEQIFEGPTIPSPITLRTTF